MPRIVSRNILHSTPWMQLIEKEVSLSPIGPSELYYCITQPAYVGVFTQTEDGRIALVRQYRPCVETHTWEFPGGTVDDGETPKASAIREVEEETGLRVREVIYFGNFHPDTGRLQVDSHAFFVKVSNPDEDTRPEPGIEVRYVTANEFDEMILSGEFRTQLDLGIYILAILHGIDIHVGALENTSPL